MMMTIPTLEPTNYIQIFYRSIMGTIYLLLCLLQEVFSVGIIIQFEFQYVVHNFKSNDTYLHREKPFVL